jgi:MATE family multidrug resistance protein
MAGQTVLGLVDTKLVGGLGPQALGGVGIATVFMYVTYSLVLGLARGIKVRTAHAVGAGNLGDGIRYAQSGAIIAALFGVIVFAIGRDISGILLRVGVDPGVVPYGRDFFAAVTYGAPGTCVLAALTQHRQATGDARTPMLIALAGNVVNAFLGYTLIYGHFGAPALGVKGGGYATACVEICEASILFALLVRDARRTPGVSRLGLVRAAREVAGIGVPTGLHFGAEVLAFATFTAILGSLAASEIAAHQIAMAVIRTSFLPGVAVGEAACVLVGQSLGRGRLRDADLVTRAALFLGVAFMAACGVVFATLGTPIARAFTDDSSVQNIARQLLLLAALFQVLDAVNIILRGALRGAKDVRATAVIGISIVWTCVPGAAFLLGKHMGWGAVGGWWGFVAETTLSASIFWLRWRRGAWRNAYERGPQSTEGGNPMPAFGQTVES